jgi:hypothetical protein
MTRLPALDAFGRANAQRSQVRCQSSADAERDQIVGLPNAQ